MFRNPNRDEWMQLLYFGGCIVLDDDFKIMINRITKLDAHVNAAVAHLLPYNIWRIASSLNSIEAMHAYMESNSVADMNRVVCGKL